ncbi:MAG: alpha-hydroxy acid oxidase, partial [Trueperaceae bacterium]
MQLDDLEYRARQAMDSATYAFVADAAGRGLTARHNEDAFRRRTLRPRVLRDVATVDTGLEVLGRRVAAPVGVAPLPRMAAVHPTAERGLAEAAAEADVVFCAATNSTVELEELVIDGATAWFQLYPHRDPGITGDLVARAVAAGYAAVVVTADRPVHGAKASEATKRTDVAAYPNLARYGDVVAGRFDASFTWQRLQDLIEACPIPVVVKGVLRGEDAHRAFDLGCGGVWVSNHGGRMLDQTIASLEALEDITVAVDGMGELYLDGGVRRGIDPLIAAALGATAVFVGRPLAYALAIGGRDGVAAALQQLRNELAHAIALMGATRLADLDR